MVEDENAGPVVREIPPEPFTGRPNAVTTPVPAFVPLTAVPVEG